MDYLVLYVSLTRCVKITPKILFIFRQQDVNAIQVLLFSCIGVANYFPLFTLNENTLEAIK